MNTDALYLGEFEQIVLLAILQLGDQAYTAPIRDEIVARTGRLVARGALYTTLDRLETKGFLVSRMADATRERGGRARRYFRVTAPGLVALRDAREALFNLWRGLDAVLDGRP